MPYIVGGGAYNRERIRNEALYKIHGKPAVQDGGD